MNNKIFFMFLIKTILGSDGTNKPALPQLTCRQSLKQISKKDYFAATLLATSLAFLISYEALQKNKSFLAKASTVVPYAISIIMIIPGQYIYLGNTNNPTTFERRAFFWNDAKNNIFLARISELAKTNAEGAYDLYAKRYGMIQNNNNNNNNNNIAFNKQILKNHQSLFETFIKISSTRAKEAIARENEEVKKSFQDLVNGLNLPAQREELLKTIFNKFTQESPNEIFGKIFVDKIKNIKIDPTDSIHNYQYELVNALKKNKNIYLTCFVEFALIEYTKEEAIDKIKEIIDNNYWTDNIDEELGRGIKAFMKKNNITDKEVKELIKNALEDKRKKLVLSIFLEKVFSQDKE